MRALARGASGFQVWPITEGLPSSRHRAVEPSSSQEPLPLLGPELRPRRVAHRGPGTRLVAARPRVDEEEVGEVAERHAAPHPLGIGGIGAADGQPFLSARGTRSPCARPTAPCSGRCSAAPSRHAPSANSWSSSVAITGCAACSPARRGRAGTGVAACGSRRASRTRAAGRTAARCRRRASGSSAACSSLVDVVAEVEQEVEVVALGDARVRVEEARVELRARHHREREGGRPGSGSVRVRPTGESLAEAAKPVVVGRARFEAGRRRRAPCRRASGDASAVPEVTTSRIASSRATCHATATGIEHSTWVQSITRSASGSPLATP